MAKEMGTTGARKKVDFDLLSSTCKTVSKNWPIQVAWFLHSISVRGKTLGSVLIVEVDRAKSENDKKKLLTVLREAGQPVVLKDEKGFYAPFAEGLLQAISENFEKGNPVVVWRSPKNKAKVRTSGRCKR